VISIDARQQERILGVALSKKCSRVVLCKIRLVQYPRTSFSMWVDSAEVTVTTEDEYTIQDETRSDTNSPNENKENPDLPERNVMLRPEMHR
jgi:hypothetical protein